MKFQQKLKLLRKDKNLSQEEMAALFGVSRQAVSIWETGQGLPDTDKLIQISDFFNVSLDYLLKDDNQPSPPPEPDEADFEPANAFADEPEPQYSRASARPTRGLETSPEMVRRYLNEKMRSSMLIALGVGIIIFSIAFVLLFDNTGGVVLFLLGVAVGVGILVVQSFRPRLLTAMDREDLALDPEFLREFRERYEQAKMRHGALIAMGIVLIIVGVVAGLIFDGVMHLDESWQAVMPVFWAVGVGLIIVGVSAMQAGKVIAYNDEHQHEVKKERKAEALNGMIMPVAVVVFLLMGFVWGAWHPGWLVFPVAALISGGLGSLISEKTSDKNKTE